MQIHILASGSTGNAVFVQMGQTKVLIDAGISNRRIEKGLGELGIKVSDIDGILITHEHIDHVKGLEVLTRKYKVPVYTRCRTWKNMNCLDKIPPECIKEIENHISLGGLDIIPFNISHDAADPVGYCIYNKNRKIVIATDFGMVTPAIEKALACADFIVLETNHDIDMLKNGPYPQFLKQRISSSKGHLSNRQAGQVLARIPLKAHTQVMLAHLSQQNNYPALAEETVKNILTHSGLTVDKDIILHRTYPQRTASLVV
ncbi:MAG: MBL fold metallo-hydrolase [Syntrophomonadaceae bacterium]|jgi:phosphoribosyl 1,2-cyclic phosphodiesterase|nr:MBL fold metallo-hydrolase [Syntrophomonadaceae bacterium]